MPTYEYVCEKCEHQFDFSQSIKDPALVICPKEKCGMKKWGKGKVKRGISAGAGLIFKGSGFYITDYRSENYKKSAKAEAGGGAAAPAPAAGGAATAGSESKPAAPATPAKTESKPKTDTK